MDRAWWVFLDECMRLYGTVPTKLVVPERMYKQIQTDLESRQRMYGPNHPYIRGMKYMFGPYEIEVVQGEEHEWDVREREDNGNK